MAKTWKIIKGYENTYVVSNDGFVKNIFRNRLLKPGSGKLGWYLRVNLTKEKKIKTKYIHRLVAECFIPNPENKKCINHINGNKQDNRVENLEWVTHSENTLHAWNNGLMENVRENLKNRVYEGGRKYTSRHYYGEENSRSKLTNKQVLEIRSKYTKSNRWHKGYDMLRLAKEYNVCKSKIFQIISRQSWKHII